MGVLLVKYQNPFSEIGVLTFVLRLLQRSQLMAVRCFRPILRWPAIMK
jgi:hypothetical protein